MRVTPLSTLRKFFFGKSFTGSLHAKDEEAFLAHLHARKLPLCSIEHEDGQLTIYQRGSFISKAGLTAFRGRLVRDGDSVRADGKFEFRIMYKLYPFVALALISFVETADGSTGKLWLFLPWATLGIAFQLWSMDLILIGKERTIEALLNDEER